MRWTIEVAGGEVPIVADDDAGASVVILAHGAASNMDTKTQEWLSGLLRRAGFSVIRFNFLYSAKGGTLPDRMPVLKQTYRAVVESVCTKISPKVLIIGGHSMGGRVASMLMADDSIADALLLFGYPLHPTGKPEELRSAHLPSIKTPTLQFSGTNDHLCTPELMNDVVSTLRPGLWALHWLEGADHGYALRKSSGRTRADLEEEIVGALLSWKASFQQAPSVT